MALAGINTGLLGLMGCQRITQTTMMMLANGVIFAKNGQVKIVIQQGQNMEKLPLSFGPENLGPEKSKPIWIYQWFNYKNIKARHNG